MKTIKLTTHWTAEDADAIYRFLDELKDAVWQAYGEEIIEMYREIEEEINDETEEFNDNLPF